MGMLGGPVANIAQQGLRAAMTAHNMATIASLVDENASSRTSSRRRRPSRPRLRTSRRSMAGVGAGTRGQLRRRHRFLEHGCRVRRAWPVTEPRIRLRRRRRTLPRPRSRHCSARAAVMRRPVSRPPIPAKASRAVRLAGARARGQQRRRERGAIRPGRPGAAPHEGVTGRGEYVVRAVPRHRRLLEAINAGSPRQIR